MIRMRALVLSHLVKFLDCSSLQLFQASLLIQSFSGTGISVDLANQSKLGKGFHVDIGPGNIGHTTLVNIYNKTVPNVKFKGKQNISLLYTHTFT